MRLVFAILGLLAWAGVAHAQNPVAPTPPCGDDSNRLATTAFVANCSGGGNEYIDMYINGSSYGVVVTGNGTGGLYLASGNGPIFAISAAGNSGGGLVVETYALGASDEGAGTVNALNGYYEDNTAGVSCSGTPSSSFASAKGIVTHC